MRVRSGGFSNAAETGNSEYWAIDPTGSFFVLSTGLAHHAEISSQKVCEDIIKLLIPHRSQMAEMSADARPDSRQMLMSTLCGAMARAERSLFELAEQAAQYKDMAATADLLYLSNGSVYIGHVGYNRVYLLRGDMGRQLTIDHTVYEYLKSQGKSEEELARTAYKDRIVRALGMTGGADIDTLQVDLRKGDRIVICSYGVHRCIQNATHLAQLYRSMDPQRASEFLVNYAIEHGCTGEASAICIEISDPGLRSSSLETESRITALEQICFFRDLSYQEMLQIMPITFEKSFAAGEEIIHEGDVGEELFILVEGTCEVSNSGVKIAKLDVGSSFGELSLVDSQPRSATVRALEPSRVLVIRANDFERLTLSGALAVKLLWNVTHELSERLRKSSATIKRQGLMLIENGISK
ncbi:MAG: cyclic nucleotide-binding domain-containing protein [Proteobacteria bacterium]|nr:cyclic nucleotide-binding domain-containing protein [Pseudomonadota bacterium]